MKWRGHKERTFPISLYRDRPAWEYVFEAFMEDAMAEVPNADTIHVMVSGVVADDRKGA